MISSLQHQLEQASPQIIGKDAEIWLGFIKRDIPDWHLKPHEPKDPKNWWKVYRKLKEDARKDSTAEEAMLKAALANIKTEKEQNTTSLASSYREVPQLPPPSRRARIQYNYLSGRTGSKGANKMTLMEKIRKEARDAKSSKMNRPTHELQKRATTVIKAPQQFVEDFRQKRAATAAGSPPRNTTTTTASRVGKTPRPPLHAPRTNAKPSIVTSSYDLTQDREARLRALKNGGSERRDMQQRPSAPAGGSVPRLQEPSPEVQGNLTLDFLEDSDGDDDNDEPARRSLQVHDRRPRAPSPMTLNLQSHSLKRKQPPSPFVSSPKRIVR
jgi:elongin-A